MRHFYFLVQMVYNPIYFRRYEKIKNSFTSNGVSLLMTRRRREIHLYDVDWVFARVVYHFHPSFESVFRACLLIHNLCLQMMSISIAEIGTQGRLLTTYDVILVDLFDMHGPLECWQISQHPLPLTQSEKSLISNT